VNTPEFEKEYGRTKSYVARRFCSIEIRPANSLPIPPLTQADPETEEVATDDLTFRRLVPKRDRIHRTP